MRPNPRPAEEKRPRRHTLYPTHKPDSQNWPIGRVCLTVIKLLILDKLIVSGRIMLGPGSVKRRRGTAGAAAGWLQSEGSTSLVNCDQTNLLIVLRWLRCDAPPTKTYIDINETAFCCHSLSMYWTGWCFQSGNEGKYESFACTAVSLICGFLWPRYIWAWDWIFPQEGNETFVQHYTFLKNLQV